MRAIVFNMAGPDRTRYAPAIEVRERFTGADMVAVLEFVIFPGLASRRATAAKRIDYRIFVVEYVDACSAQKSSVEPLSTYSWMEDTDLSA